MESCRHGKRPRAGRERREHEEEEVDIPGAAIDGHGRGGGPTGRSVERGGGDKGGGNGIGEVKGRGPGWAGYMPCPAAESQASGMCGFFARHCEVRACASEGDARAWCPWESLSFYGVSASSRTVKELLAFW